MDQIYQDEKRRDYLIMDELVICPKCHILVKPTDYYCSNCGTSIHPTPPSVSAGTQIGLYLGSIFLPPMGIIWSFKYLKQPDTKSKTIGLVLIGLTVFILIAAVVETIQIINTVNTQMGSTLQNMGGIGGF
jgi:hypothetical protein